MNIRECYAQFNGNFDDVLERLLTEDRVKKFSLRFIDNNDLADLKNHIDSKDWGNAFVSAHTLKGLALNLGFTDFAKTTSEITEILRPKKVDDNGLIRINELLEEADKQAKNIETALKSLD